MKNGWIPLLILGLVIVASIGWNGTSSDPLPPLPEVTTVDPVCPDGNCPLAVGSPVVVAAPAYRTFYRTTYRAVGNCVGNKSAAGYTYAPTSAYGTSYYAERTVARPLLFRRGGLFFGRRNGCL